jgi:hypothetical protein
VSPQRRWVPFISVFVLGYVLLMITDGPFSRKYRTGCECQCPEPSKISESHTRKWNMLDAFLRDRQNVIAGTPSSVDSQTQHGKQADLQKVSGVLIQISTASSSAGLGCVAKNRNRTAAG